MGGWTTPVSSSTGGGVAEGVTAVFTWQRRPIRGTAAALRATALRVLERLGITRGEVGVLVCSDETIRSLNRTYRGRDEPTDVLAFPVGETPPDGPPYLGDIAISLDTARRQAAARRASEVNELRVLLLHGLLHLLGYDHERDQGEMAALEQKLRMELEL